MNTVFKLKPMAKMLSLMLLALTLVACGGGEESLKDKRKRLAELKKK